MLVCVARSGPLAAWTCSWLLGQVSLDQVVDAVTATDAPHRVAGLDVFGLEPVSLRDLLIAWRRAGAPVRLHLPVPGDVRGVPAPEEFRAAALDAGEAVSGGGVGVVPEITEYFPSSAPTTVEWQAVTVGPPPPDHLDVADAQYELTTAVRECASALAAADVASSRDRIGSALTDARRAGERLNLPPGFPPRAVAMVAQSERLQAVLDLALSDPAGGAVDRFGMSARSSALRPLAAAVRRARICAYNALADRLAL